MRLGVTNRLQTSLNLTLFQISLPPLVEDDGTRKALASTLRKTRERFRSFRTKLSAELRENKGKSLIGERNACVDSHDRSLTMFTVLPKQLRDRVVADLDKRLDLDIDELLESPKLRLQLSPAELDKSLLELYDTISESPSGDLLRLISGGGAIGLQNLYMRRKTQKNMATQQGIFLEFFPSPLDDADSEDLKRTPSQRVRWALRKNVPVGGSRSPTTTTSRPPPPSQDQNSLHMCGVGRSWRQPCRDVLPVSWSGLRSPTTTIRPTRTALTVTTLRI